MFTSPLFGHKFFRLFFLFSHLDDALSFVKWTGNDVCYWVFHVLYPLNPCNLWYLSVTGNDNNRYPVAISSFESLWGGGNMFHDSSSSSIINGERQWRQRRNKGLWKEDHGSWRKTEETKKAQLKETKAIIKRGCGTSFKTERNPRKPLRRRSHKTGRNYHGDISWTWASHLDGWTQQARVVADFEVPSEKKTLKQIWLRILSCCFVAARKKVLIRSAGSLASELLLFALYLV